MSDSRTLTLLAENADEAVRAYAAALWEWNAPDDEYTRRQLRSLVDDVIAEGRTASSHSEPPA